eukprot:3933379-Prymnesium_polylepis.1
MSASRLRGPPAPRARRAGCGDPSPDRRCGTATPHHAPPCNANGGCAHPRCGLFWPVLMRVANRFAGDTLQPLVCNDGKAVRYRIFAMLVASNGNIRGRACAFSNLSISPCSNASTQSPPLSK